MYWGLDYPPLTAYHSWMCGFMWVPGSGLVYLWHEQHKKMLILFYGKQFSLVVIISRHCRLTSYAWLEVWDLNHCLNHLLKLAQLKIAFCSYMAAMLWLATFWLKFYSMGCYCGISAVGMVGLFVSVKTKKEQNKTK